MKVGLITYHSAYNFGSVLQAYASQEVIKQLGADVKIINYRMNSQKQYYSLLGYGKGIKVPLKKLMMLPQLSGRKKRRLRYEQFIADNMSLTFEVNEPDEFDIFNDSFDVYVSGSDQIWNLHSNEFNRVGIEYMKPYLLTFTNHKKISYASSIVNMNEDELLKLKKYLLEFKYISCREKSSSLCLKRILNRPINTVLDPTLLVSKIKWNDLADKSTNRNIVNSYILYYSLKNFKDTYYDLLQLREIAKKEKLLIVAITPLIPVIPLRGIVNVIDAGPLEFLDLIRNAELIATDSYHGTLFSISFEKKFYYIKNTAGDQNMRATQILSALSLTDRMIDSFRDIVIDKNINYSEVMECRESLIKESMIYFEEALLN